LRHGPFGPIDLVDHVEQQLSNHELAGPKPSEAGGAARGGQGASHLRNLGFALPPGWFRHSICRGHVAGK